jgi:ABC-type branched-subunit amino acid transport system substrate-binding protein
MLKSKCFLSVLLLLLSIFYSISYATEIDLIYNLSGSDGSACQAAWHGARVAKHILDENGNRINLVLYNGQSVSALNAAIGKMRAQSESAPIIIGLGTQQEMIAAAKPIVSANKIFIAAGSFSDAEKVALGDNFFSFFSQPSSQWDLATTHFDKLYQEQFHQQPTTDAYGGYNAVMLAAAALKSTADHSSEELSYAIKRLTANSSLSAYPFLTVDQSKIKSLG